MLATMQRLGVAHTRSRPSVSNDNPYVESAFRTLKYRPQLPVKPFENLLAARRWVTELAHWYNHAHRHSAIGFVTPAQRHAGLDRTLLEARVLVYERARQENPQRWSGQPRQWAHVDVVHHNPETPQIKEPEDTKKNSLTHFTSGDNFLDSHRHLHTVGALVGEQVRGMRVGCAEDSDHPGQRRVGACAHVQRRGGQPHRVNANHRSHSRSQAAHDADASNSQLTVTDPARRSV